MVELAAKTLNDGLRPVLTKWQARFRRRYLVERKNHPELSPQELQERFPEFEEMLDDIRQVNADLCQYAEELEKPVGLKGLSPIGWPAQETLLWKLSEPAINIINEVWAEIIFVSSVRNYVLTG